MPTTRLTCYRNIYQCALDSADPAHSDLWDAYDGPAADVPTFPLAANLLVLLDDLRVLVSGDPTLDDDAAADLAATIDAAWADLSTEYDYRTLRHDGGDYR